MTTEWPPLSSIKTELRGPCPQCGQSQLYVGFPTVKPECEVCSRDRSLAAPADRLRFFVICFIWVTGVALACRIQVAYSPSIWVHLFAAFPPVLLACLLPPWALKGWLISSRFCFNAKEGKIDPNYIRGELRNRTPSAVDIDTCDRRPN